MHKLLPFFTLFTTIIFSQTPGAGVTDIEGNYYSTVIIGSQEWMSENLKTSKYSNGVNIPTVTDNIQWNNLTDGAYCFYNNDANNNLVYGKLYNYYSVISSNNLCPNGWHVPNISEWDELRNFLDPTVATSGGQMKSNSTLWTSPNVGATNSSGFSALPAGFRNHNEPTSGVGVFSSKGTMAWFWTSEEANLLSAYNRYLINVDDPLFYSADNKNDALSIRCMKNQTTGLFENIQINDYILRITNILGQSIEKGPNQIMIIYYKSGAVKKVYITE